MAENGFAPIPDELFSKLLSLSHLDRSVFLLLCLKGYREIEPRGIVPFSITAIAMWCETSTGSIRRALRSLDGAGLVDYVRGGIRVIHYKNGKCTEVDHGDPSLDHGDPHPDHGDPGGGSSRSIKSPQLSTTIGDTTPSIRSEDDLDVVDVAASTNGGQEKRKAPVRKKRVKPWIRWDSEANAVVVDEGDDRAKKFTEKWIGLLGSSDRVYDEFFKFSKWMKDDLRRPQRTKNFARAFGNWLEKEISDG